VGFRCTLTSVQLSVTSFQPDCMPEQADLSWGGLVAGRLEDSVPKGYCSVPRPSTCARLGFLLFVGLLVRKGLTAETRSSVWCFYKAVLGGERGEDTM
jgi:hypothetical protein